MTAANFLLGFFLALAPAAPRYEVPTAVPQVVQLNGNCSAFVAAPGVYFTAAHCVREDAEAGEHFAEVRFVDGYTTRVFVLGYGDEDSRDWAVLVGDTHGVTPLTLASAPAVPGSVCADVGYGGGLPQQRATPCVVVGSESGYVVLSATIIGGDSGSPVVDSQTGEVVGIAVRSRYPVPQGLATPIARAVAGAAALLKSQHVIQP